MLGSAGSPRTRLLHEAFEEARLAFAAAFCLAEAATSGGGDFLFG